MLDLQKAILEVMLGKKEQVEEAKKPLHPNQQKLDVHEPEKDELTAKDFEMLRAGKKAKMKEEVEDIEEGMKEKEIAAAYVKNTTPKKKDNSAQLKATADKLKSMYGEPRNKANEEFEITDDVDETIISHTSFNIELKEAYVFGDFLNAAKNLVGEEEAVELANEMFNTQDISIFIAEAMQNTIKKKMQSCQNEGHEVSMPKYSNKSGRPCVEFVTVNENTGFRRKYIYLGKVEGLDSEE